MAVVEMKKLNLVALAYDRDRILNALQVTQAIEIKLHSTVEHTTPIECDSEALREKLSAAESALEALLSRVENHYKEQKIVSDNVGEVEITYSEFFSAAQSMHEVEDTIGRIEKLLEREKDLDGELVRLRRLLSSARIYGEYELPLHVENTAHTVMRVGTIPSHRKDDFVVAAGKLPLIAYNFGSSDGESELISLAAHKAAESDMGDLLQAFDFSACPFDDDRTGKQLYTSYKLRESAIEQEKNDIQGEILSFDSKIRQIKIYCDYVAFELEKQESSANMLQTASTFLLEAYVPVPEIERVGQAIDGVSDAVWYCFSTPSDDETPPTLLKNNKIVKNFEAVTDMYSPVNYREFDPNTVMAFFYSLFLGFIMGDVIYGMLMFVLGGFMWIRSKRETSIKKLAGVFAVGGVFAVFWGFLFNSFLGMAALPYTVMPDAKSGRYSLMGIRVPSVLIISMLIGMVQLCAGYVCKAVQMWRRGEIFGGIFDGISWAVFMVGTMLLVCGLVEEFSLKVLTLPGAVIMGVGLVTAMLTAGRKEKLLGKFTKGFGAAYGVINIVSDILSYARLYGLMLSGAVIAQIISGFVVTGYEGSTPFLFSGNIGLIVLGIILMFVGHAFNLAIGLLGAYIHDARLQYVEFYGRFFEGEGTLFAPLGSSHKYIYLTSN